MQTDERLTLPHIAACLSNVAICLTAGGLSIALVCTKTEKNAQYLHHTSLIIFSCASIISGLIQFPLTLWVKLPLLRLLFSLPQILMLGTSISYINYLVKYLPNTLTMNSTHRQTITAHISFLLLAMFTSGFSTCMDIFTKEKGRVQNDLEKFSNMDCTSECDIKVDSDKTVLFKASAATLTPDQDPEQLAQPQQNWMNESPTTYSGSENASTSSVVKYMMSGESHSNSGSSMNARLRSASCTAVSPVSKRRVLSRFRSKKNLKRKFSLKDKITGHRAGIDQPEKQQRQRIDRKSWSKQPDIDARFVTRLSTIPDTSKSLLNLINTSQKVDSTSKSVTSLPPLEWLSQNEDYDVSAIRLEKDAIGRINSALLPPCLRMSNGDSDNGSNQNEFPVPFFNEDPPEVVEINNQEDGLLAHDLQNIPQIPTWGVVEHEMPDENKNQPNNLRNISLQEWELNGTSLMKKERELTNIASQLLPPIQYVSEDSLGLESKENFSFPPSKQKLDIGKLVNEEDGDTVSVLDELFKKESGCPIDRVQDTNAMEQVLRQDNPSVFFDRMSKDLSISTRQHSPTKSVTSVATGSATGSLRSPSKLGSFFGTSSAVGTNHHHTRSNSQFTLLTSSMNLVGANNSVHSSPSKGSRLKKRLSKKLSLSNISFKLDDEEDFNNNNNNNNLFHTHNRGQSIDFSYVHTLQSKHSPSKSVSTIGGRRNSILNASEKGLRSVSALLLLQSEGANSMFQDVTNAPVTVEENGNAEADGISRASSPLSKGSNTKYPDAVFSEYDREKWTTLMSLNRVQTQSNIIQ